MRERNDEQLVRQYLKGDEKSLEVLIERHLKPIYNFVRRYIGNAIDAEDITQEVFVKTWRNLKKFNQQKKFKTWLFAIAKNTCFDYLRKRRFISFSAIEEEGRDGAIIKNLVDASAGSEQIISRLDAQQKIIPALKKLPPKYRMVLHFRFHNQLTFREIAAVLNEPLNTIKSQYRRALTMLREIIVEP